jgi:hypothetical protein
VRRLAPALALLLAACASTNPPPPAPPDAPIVRAIRVEDPVIVDGSDNDAAWERAPGTEVPLEDGAAASSCIVKAAVHRGTLCLLLRWSDPTETRTGRLLAGSWPASAYFPVGDSSSVVFAVEGRLEPSLGMATNGVVRGEAVWNAWTWDAAGTDREGRARDRVLGRRAAEHRDPTPGPTAAVVAARGRWSDGTWTVEMARGLRATRDGTCTLEGLDETSFFVETVDMETGDSRRTSPVLRLLLPPPEPVPWEPMRFR